MDNIEDRKYNHKFKKKLLSAALIVQGFLDPHWQNLLKYI